MARSRRMRRRADFIGRNERFAGWRPTYLVMTGESGEFPFWRERTLDAITQFTTRHPR